MYCPGPGPGPGPGPVQVVRVRPGPVPVRSAGALILLWFPYGNQAYAGISSGRGLRTAPIASSLLAPRRAKLLRACSRLTRLAPPSSVGFAAWAASSSQLHTGQISNVPGGCSLSVRQPQQGHLYIATSLAIEIGHPSARFEHNRNNRKQQGQTTGTDETVPVPAILTPRSKIAIDRRSHPRLASFAHLCEPPISGRAFFLIQQ